MRHLCGQWTHRTCSAAKPNIVKVAKAGVAGWTKSQPRPSKPASTDSTATQRDNVGTVGSTLDVWKWNISSSTQSFSVTYCTRVRKNWDKFTAGTWSISRHLVALFACLYGVKWHNSTKRLLVPGSGGKRVNKLYTLQWINYTENVNGKTDSLKADWAQV